MGKLQIDILGTSFAIQAAEDTDYLHKLMGYYKQMVEGIENKGGLKEPLKISILSGILICDELYKEKLKNAKNKNTSDNSFEDQELERLTADMIAKIDKALG
ncbi:MAG: cell division protein ZapA [Treponema sp.]|jgi:cell division protein ZapA|nr:cell division protein ZapA [Treponema sp.]